MFSFILYVLRQTVDNRAPLLLFPYPPLLLWRFLSSQIFCVHYSSTFRNITSKFRPIAILKSFVKQNNDSNKICNVHDLLPHQTSLSKCKGSCCNHKHNINLKRSTSRGVRIFPTKNGLIKSCSTFEDLSAYISRPHVDWCQVLHPPQKFEHPLLWNGWRYRIKTTASRSSSEAWSLHRIS
jgi:hypothetical protein